MDRVELAPARVGVIQHEPEMLLTPAHDIVPFLRSKPERWSLEAFDERNFGALLGAPRAFDVIVIGFNAVLNCRELRVALEQAPPTVPVLILHQREPDCWAFLRDDLALALRSLEGAADEAWAPRERDPDDEPLLRWPNDVVGKDRPLRCPALSAFSFSPDGAWRVALETSQRAQRVPVVVRTRSNHARRVVACSLMLRPRDDEGHGRLLDNLLTYCASGRPELAVADLAGVTAAYDADAVARGLRMWSEQCVRVSLAVPDKIPMDRWPLRGVRRLLVPQAVEPDAVRECPGGDTWFKRGGVLVRMDAADRLTYHAGAVDRLLVLRRWAVWFGAASPEAWLQRISTTRAVLRLLDELDEEDREILGEDLRVEVSPQDYADAVAQLLSRRVRHGHVEQTVSATAAALDLHRLTGGQALTPWTEREVRRWLRQRLPTAAPEDQLDIVRCLRDQAALRDQLLRHGPEHVSAVYATRLREAVRACWPAGDEPDSLVPEAIFDALAAPVLADELARRPLLSAEFLAALHAPVEGADPQPRPRLFDSGSCPAAEEAALSRLRSPNPSADASDARLVCARTLAMLRHVTRNPLGAIRALPQTGELPAGTVEAVLEEATRARSGEREARRDLPALGTATLLLGTAALALAAIGLLALWDAADVATDPWSPALPVALAAALVGLAPLRWLLIPRLEPRGDRRDLRFAQSIVGLLALAVALVAGTWGWTLGGDSLSGKLAMGPLLFTTAFGLAVLVLRRYRVAPGWARELLSITADMKSPLAVIGERIRRQPEEKS